MINYPAIAQSLAQQMSIRNDSVRGLAKLWGVSPMSITNARRGRPLSAEMLLRVCLYTGDNPLVFWQEEGITYGNLFPRDTL